MTPSQQLIRRVRGYRGTLDHEVARIERCTIGDVHACRRRDLRNPFNGEDVANPADLDDTTEIDRALDEMMRGNRSICP